MDRYCAFLRGVSPMNAKMPELKRAFEAAGFKDVKTLLSSGNVVFSTPGDTVDVLERRAEAAMESELGHHFGTIVRPAWYLRKLIDSDPYAQYKLPAEAKRIITFFRRPPETNLPLPIERDGASILGMTGSELLSAYLPGDKGPVFMMLIERAFGSDLTTRTVDTVRKCAFA
jgi:uncharacterized protein (DUF1697 family)